MIQNVRDIVGRMEAIRATIARTTGPSSTPAASRTATPVAAFGEFDRIMADATRQHLTPRTLGDLVGRAPAPAPWIQNSAPPAARNSGAPPGLERFANGQIPTEYLAAIPGTNEHMWGPAAAAFTRMRADARAAGIDLPVIDAYRPLEDQHRLARELGLYSEGGWAAVPGTSQHGWGRAIDLELDDRALNWMRTNAGRYGFIETVPREPWHWEFHGS